MEHLTDHPASNQRVCLRCGNVGHIDRFADCLAGRCPNTCEEGAVVPLTARSVNQAWDIARTRVRGEANG